MLRLLLILFYSFASNKKAIATNNKLEYNFFYSKAQDKGKRYRKDANGQKDKSRPYMEDEYVIADSDDKKMKIFGIFDGHRGDNKKLYCDISKDLSKNFSKLLFNKLKFLNEIKDIIKNEDKIKKTIEAAFLEYDKELFKKNFKGGSTANIVLFFKNKMIFINLGDSRALLIKNGKYEFSTEDHKANTPVEALRIKNSDGGYIVKKYRLASTHYKRNAKHGLGVSRSFGDFDLKIKYNNKREKVFIEKKPPLSNCPDIKIYNLSENKNDEYAIILGSDGIWDGISNNYMTEIYNENKNKSEKEIADKIKKTAIYLTDPHIDNITVIIVKIKAN